MAIPTGYNAGADGPSAGAIAFQTAASNVVKSAANTSDYNEAMFQAKNQYQNVDRPQLISSIGANGQAYSTASSNAQNQQANAERYKEYGLTSAFSRAQDDMTRQQVFASMGIVLG